MPTGQVLRSCLPVKVYHQRIIIRLLVFLSTLVLFLNIYQVNSIQNFVFFYKQYLIPDNATKFTDYENSYTRTYHMVCVTSRNIKGPEFAKDGLSWYTGEGKYQLPGRTCLHKRKFITVYDDSYKLLEKRMPYDFNVFEIKFRNASDRPKNYTISNQTAYFLGEEKTFEPKNFFHFTRQIYFPLYWLIQSTNQLHSDAHNLVFYPKPYAYCVNQTYIPLSMDLYQTFRDVLFVRNKDELSAHMDRDNPDQICYENAVFTTDLFIEQAAMAIEHFNNQMGVNDSLCDSNKTTVTILNRKAYRRILNVDQLKSIGLALGYDTREVVMETMSFQEQAQIIHCTSILVGVVGAGLQWAFFMKNHSGVVEIGWPQRKWRFFFTGRGDYHSNERDVIRPLTFVQLENVNCHINPRSPGILLKDLYGANQTIAPSVARAIIKDSRNFDYKTRPGINIGKLCDVIVDTGAFRKAVIAVAKKVTKIPRS